MQGLKALHSPHTGIVDWAEVTRMYAKNFEAKGGVVRLGFEVTDFKESGVPDFPVTVHGKNAVSAPLDPPLDPPPPQGDYR